MILTVGESKNHVPFPEGIHPVVCVDVMDLGMVTSNFGGKVKTQPKLKIVFEGECVSPEGFRCCVSKKVTASLHPKAKLFELLGKWRGRPLAVGEQIDLERLIGACATVVVSHEPLRDGSGVFAKIDAISKPTKKVVASGEYDRTAAAQRERERAAKYGNEEEDDDDRAAAPAPAAPRRMVTPPAAMPAPPAVAYPVPPAAAAAPPPPLAALPPDHPENDDVPF